MSRQNQKYLRGEIAGIPQIDGDNIIDIYYIETKPAYLVLGNPIGWLDLIVHKQQFNQDPHPGGWCVAEKRTGMVLANQTEYNKRFKNRDEAVSHAIKNVKRYTKKKMDIIVNNVLEDLKQKGIINQKGEKLCLSEAKLQWLI